MPIKECVEIGHRDGSLLHPFGVSDGDACEIRGATLVRLFGEKLKFRRADAQALCRLINTEHPLITQLGKRNLDLFRIDNDVFETQVAIDTADTGQVSVKD